MADFTAFVLSQLPPPPARVLEIGCGSLGGVAPALAAAGYDVLAIDPRAPEGPLFRQVRLEELDDPGPFDAVVAGRVLHHVDPLGPALDKLTGLAPLLILDEFAWNHMDDVTAAWYERTYPQVEGPSGPPDVAAWLAEHRHLHTYEALRAELDGRYEERSFERLPYLHHWLGAAIEPAETEVLAAGKIRPLGWRYAGIRRAS
ncbi:MAG: hypothetical protein QOE36_1424 [Gaiellaceae bacterium]|nr:hypothetical protein [Gaiellaceae bacterium]